MPVPYGQQLVEPAGTRVLQRRQVAASAALYFPAGHGAQAAAAELRNEPAGHGAAWAAAVMARSSAVWRMRRAVSSSSAVDLRRAEHAARSQLKIL